jgi:hypothetical protein
MTGALIADDVEAVCSPCGDSSGLATPKARFGVAPPPADAPGNGSRSSLIERLARPDARSIVLVVAPAGYGKTTLLSPWVERNGEAFAWVSVDETDNDPKVLKEARPDRGLADPAQHRHRDTCRWELTVALRRRIAVIPHSLRRVGAGPVQLDGA